MQVLAEQEGLDQVVTISLLFLLLFLDQVVTISLPVTYSAIKAFTRFDFIQRVWKNSKSYFSGFVILEGLALERIQEQLLKCWAYLPPVM